MQKKFTYAFKCYNMPFSDLIKINALFVNKSDLLKIKNDTSSKNNVYINISQNIMEIKDSDDVKPGSIGMGFLFRRMIKYGKDSPEIISFDIFNENQMDNNLKYLKLIVTTRNNEDELIKLDDKILINIFIFQIFIF